MTMRERDFLQKALRDSFGDPTEQTFTEVMNHRRHGRVRSSFVKYAAIAAVSALIAAIAVKFILSKNDVRNEPANDITSSVSSDVRSEPSNDISSSDPSSETDDSGTDPEIAKRVANNKLRSFASDLKNHPELISCSVNNILLMDAGPTNTRNRGIGLWFDNCLAEKKSELYTMIANSLLKGDLEYIGDKEPSMSESEAKEKLKYQKGIIFYYSDELGDLDSNNNLNIDLNIYNGKITVILTMGIKNGNLSETRTWYFSKKDDLNLFEDGKIMLNEWGQSSANYSDSLPGDVPMEERKLSFDLYDHQKRIFINLTVRYEDGMPVVDIGDMTLPEGVSITKCNMQILFQDSHNVSYSPIQTDKYEAGTYSPPLDNGKWTRETKFNRVYFSISFSTNEHPTYERLISETKTEKVYSYVFTAGIKLT